MSQTTEIAIAEIENIGPIKSVKIPVPVGGGLLVMKGRNGAGKSTVLNVFDKALGKDVKLQKNERAVGSGHFESPFGVALKVSQTTRRTEDDDGLTVEVLDDEFQIGDLVDPREKDAAAADRRRLKALLRTAKAEADIADFVQLFRSEAEFERIVRDETRKLTDPVEMAARVKGDIEAEARLIEAEVAKAETEILKLQGALEGFDPEANAIDIEQVRADHEAAVENLGALKRDRAAYVNAVELIDGLIEREAAAKAAAEIDFDTLIAETESVEAGIKSTDAAIAEFERQVEQLTRRINEKKQERQTFAAKLEAARSKVESSRASRELLASIQNQLTEARSVPAVEESDLIAAKERSEELGRRIGESELIARKLEQVESLKVRQAEKRTLEKQATELREAAKATDGVLTDMVKTLGTPIKIGYDDKGNARLIVPHAGRDRDIYFGELSKGEKLYLVTSIAIKAVGPGGMFTIPQELFEGLDDENRARIAEQLKGTEVVAVTAQCSGGELRGEIFQAESSGAEDLS